MAAFRHLLVATDLSVHATAALDRAFRLAQMSGARLTAIHALGLPALSPYRALMGEVAEQVAQTVTTEARTQLRALLDDPRRNGGYPADLHLEADLPAPAITAFAAANGVDLVLVGAQGRNFWQRMLLGSTASHLLRKSRWPVLVVKQPALEPYRRVVVAMDFSPVSAAALALARQIAPGAKLVLAHVFELPFEGMLTTAGVRRVDINRYQAEVRDHAQLTLHEMARQAGLAPDEYRLDVRHGPAGGILPGLVHQAGADLVVMGKHGTHVTEELLLGSVTKRMLAESAGDVLVVVDERPAREWNQAPADLRS